MILDNLKMWYKSLGYSHINGTDSPVKYTNILGKTVYASCASQIPLLGWGATNWIYTHLLFGIGTTAVLPSDYKLSNYLFAYSADNTSSTWRGDYSKFTIDHTISSKLTDDGYPEVLHSILIKNSSLSNTYKITEIGKAISGSSQWSIDSKILSSSYSDVPILIERTLLDSPLVITPGETAFLKYRIKNMFAFHATE